jgi:hypothetical protein
MSTLGVPDEIGLYSIPQFDLLTTVLLQQGIAKKMAKARSEAYLYDRREESDKNKPVAPAFPEDQEGSSNCCMFFKRYFQKKGGE